MSFINHSDDVVPLSSLMPRRLMLAASALAAAATGTAFAGESAAADFFVDKVMVVQTGHVASQALSVPVVDRVAYDSAQDQFVDQVLRGRLAESGASSGNRSAPSNDPPSWPDVGFLRPQSPR